MSLMYQSCPSCKSQNTACATCGKTTCLCYSGNSFCFNCETFFSKSSDVPMCKCANATNENKVVCAKCKVWRKTGVDAWQWQNRAIPYCGCVRTDKNMLKCWTCGVVRINEDAPWEFADRNYEYTYSCNHLNSKITFLDGKITVYASSVYHRDPEEETAPDFGLYMDGMWTPMGPAYFLGWQDFGLPYNWTLAAQLIFDVYNKATLGKWVEIGCIGGHGRTGTVLACMAVLAGHSAKSAIDYIRTTYCIKAIETKEQEWFVSWFECYMFGGTTPGRPIKWTLEDSEPKGKKKKYVPEIYSFETGWIYDRPNPHLESLTEFDDESITWATRKVTFKPGTKSSKSKDKVVIQ